VGEDPTLPSPLAFRVLVRKRDLPLTAVLLILLSGVFPFAEGWVDGLAGVYFSGLDLSSVSVQALGLGTANILLGVAMIFLGVIHYQVRWLHSLIGGLVTMSASASLFIGGSFLFGAALGIAGGVLTITWTPTPPFYISPIDSQMCPGCGAVFRSTVRYCLTCGEMKEGAPPPTAHPFAMATLLRRKTTETV